VEEGQQERIVRLSGEAEGALLWRLVAPGNRRIQLTFDPKFGLEDPEDGMCKYDFVEIEDLSEGAVLGRWCGSHSGPGSLQSKGTQVRVRFVSDEYFPSEPGFRLHYSLLPMSEDSEV
ncbi:hypothetical protein CRUP_030455, partial [Coryphaenoides rupestris]